MKQKNLFKKIFGNKFIYLLISIILSVFMWTYVTSQETEEYKQTFRGVRVEIVGSEILAESKKFMVTDLSTSTVTISITGPRRVVSSLDVHDLVAQIDVSKLSQAAYTSQPYSIIFPDGTDTSGLRVSMKTPDSLSFLVSNIVTKPIQIRGSFDGFTAEGYTAETPVFEPSVIYISGPESYVRDIAYAWVTFSKDNVNSTYSVETGYTLKDKNGEDCSLEYITVSDELILATLPLLEVKTVPITVDVIEGAAASSENTVVTVEPATISLAGDSSILKGLNKILLKTIDLTDFSSSFSEVYTIPIPNELRNLSGVHEATVTIQIFGLETKTFRVSNLSVINVTDGYEAVILTELVDVTLRGTAEQLELVSVENIRIVADLNDYDASTGQYIAPVKVYIDSQANVGAIGEYELIVQIRKK